MVNQTMNSRKSPALFSKDDKNAAISESFKQHTYTQQRNFGFQLNLTEARAQRESLPAKYEINTQNSGKAKYEFENYSLLKQKERLNQKDQNQFEKARIIKIPDPMDILRQDIDIDIQKYNNMERNQDAGLASGLPSLPLNTSPTLTTINENVTDRTGMQTERKCNTMYEHSAGGSRLKSDVGIQILESAREQSQHEEDEEERYQKEEKLNFVMEILKISSQHLLEFLTNNSSQNGPIDVQGLELVLKMQTHLQNKPIMNDQSFQEYMILFDQFTQYINRSKLTMEQNSVESIQKGKLSHRKMTPRNNDPYGIDLASKKEGGKTHRKLQNRFKVIKKQNLETKRLETQQVATLGTLMNSSRSNSSTYDLLDSYSCDTMSARAHDGKTKQAQAACKIQSPRNNDFNQLKPKDLAIISAISNFNKRHFSSEQTKVVEQILKQNVAKHTLILENAKARLRLATNEREEEPKETKIRVADQSLSRSTNSVQTDGSAGSNEILTELKRIEQMGDDLIRIEQQYDGGDQGCIVLMDSNVVTDRDPNLEETVGQDQKQFVVQLPAAADEENQNLTYTQLPDQSPMPESASRGFTPLHSNPGTDNPNSNGQIQRITLEDPKPPSNIDKEIEQGEQQLAVTFDCKQSEQFALSPPCLQGLSESNSYALKQKSTLTPNQSGMRTENFEQELLQKQLTACPQSPQICRPRRQMIPQTRNEVKETLQTLNGQDDDHGSQASASPLKNERIKSLSMTRQRVGETAKNSLTSLEQAQAPKTLDDQAPNQKKVPMSSITGRSVTLKTLMHKTSPQRPQLDEIVDNRCDESQLQSFQNLPKEEIASNLCIMSRRSIELKSNQKSTNNNTNKCKALAIDHQGTSLYRKPKKFPKKNSGDQNISSKEQSPSQNSQCSNRYTIQLTRNSIAESSSQCGQSCIHPNTNNNHQLLKIQKLRIVDNLLDQITLEQRMSVHQNQRDRLEYNNIKSGPFSQFSGRNVSPGSALYPSSQEVCRPANLHEGTLIISPISKQMVRPKIYSPLQLRPQLASPRNIMSQQQTFRGAKLAHDASEKEQTFRLKNNHQSSQELGVAVVGRGLADQKGVEPDLRLQMLRLQMPPKSMRSHNSTQIGSNMLKGFFRNVNKSQVEAASSTMMAAQALPLADHILASYNLAYQQSKLTGSECNKDKMPTHQLMVQKYNEKRQFIEQERSRRAKISQVRVMQQQIVQNKNKILRLANKNLPSIDKLKRNSPPPKTGEITQRYKEPQEWQKTFRQEHQQPKQPMVGRRLRNLVPMNLSCNVSNSNLSKPHATQVRHIPDDQQNIPSYFKNMLKTPTQGISFRESKLWKTKFPPTTDMTYQGQPKVIQNRQKIEENQLDANVKDKENEESEQKTAVRSSVISSMKFAETMKSADFGRYNPKDQTAFRNGVIVTPGAREPSSRLVKFDQIAFSVSPRLPTRSQLGEPIQKFPNSIPLNLQQIRQQAVQHIAKIRRNGTTLQANSPSMGRQSPEIMVTAQTPLVIPSISPQGHYQAPTFNDFQKQELISPRARKRLMKQQQIMEALKFNEYNESVLKSPRSPIVQRTSKPRNKMAAEGQSPRARKQGKRGQGYR